ncbi:unnamed protein product [Ambrosiozyma monospora]|uniref:Unnamed protein product n=1 Tax=Ambrosiozyma monospora TaxID=43982 RepID=A0ACB5SYE8_AMBMO|nr:unnamed protein product [Ambrosiozyma monospora]
MSQSIPRDSKSNENDKSARTKTISHEEQKQEEELPNLKIEKSNPKSQSQLQSQSHLNQRTIETISGLSAGFLATLVAHPLDFFKLRLQLDTSSRSQLDVFKKIRDDLILESSKAAKVNNGNGSGSGSGSGVRTKKAMVGKFDKKELIKNVYRGVGPNLVGSTAAWGLYFMFYREFKNLVLIGVDLGDGDGDGLTPTVQSPTPTPNPTSSSSTSTNPRTTTTINPNTNINTTTTTTTPRSDTNLSTQHYLLSGFLAGWSTSIVTNPIWVIKTRMIATSRTTPGAYTSIWHGIKQIYRNEGWLGYYKGLTPALISVSQGAIQVALYDTIKNHFFLRGTGEKGKKGKMGVGDGKGEKEFSNWMSVQASAVSKISAMVLLYPLQVVRARLQIDMSRNDGVVSKGGGGGKSFGMIRTFVDIVKKESLRGLYKGVVAQLVRVVPSTCVTFVVYENVKRVLS